MPQFLLAALTGILGFLSFPVYSVDCLIWITLVPLLVAVSDRSPANSFWLGWLAAVVGFCGAFAWVAPSIARLEEVSLSTGTALAVAAAAYHAVQVGLFAAFAASVFASNPLRASVRSIRRSTAAAVVIASAWVALEWSFPKVIPWSFASVLSDRLAMIQIVEVTGVWGLSFFVALVNATLAITLVGWWSERRLRWQPDALTAAVLVAVWGFGVLRLGAFRDGKPTHSARENGRHSKPIRIAAIQGDVGPGGGDAATEDQTFSIYRQLTLRPPAQFVSVAATAERPALTIWPESTIRAPLPENQHFRESVLDIAEQLHEPLLIGSLDAADHGASAFNSLFVISPARALTAVYHKSRLFPFGESAPLIRSLWRTTGHLTAGESPKPLTVTITSADDTPRTVSFAPSICYEAVFPGFFNAMIRHGAQVLINITDDSWFGNTNAPWQHLQAAVFRAVETRRPLVRASNSGISAIIAPSGKIIARTGLFTRAVMRGEVVPEFGQTFYVRWGDWFPWLCLSYVIVYCAGRARGLR